MKIFATTAAMVGFASLGAGLMAMVPASADERIPVIRDMQVKQECGACHMAFQPKFLPAASWRKIMTGLDSHFGEDASLDADTARHITDYLVQHAGRNRRNAGIRITELNWFQREHNGEVSPRARKKAGTMANCTACHQGADQGYFDDD
ncbi:MAG: cytochrome C [Hyphomicrobiales bacterium]|nr:MAG: cytochrome C [Hyphomicrobiales bacterium]